MTLTPGAYLKLRRTAARLDVHAVARRLSTQPRMAEHIRADWVMLIEADAAPASFSTIVALHHVFPFDLAVLARLEAIRLGVDVPPPRLCRVCGCSEDDPCRDELGGVCGIADIDLCSDCADAHAVRAEAAAA